jgi:ankyrin repeat protein
MAFTVNYAHLAYNATLTIEQIRTATDTRLQDNYAGFSILYCSCWAGQLDIVKTLVEERGQDVNRREPNGFTCLMATVSSKRCHETELAYYLINKGANVYAVTDSGDNLLHRAVEAKLPVNLLSRLCEYSCGYELIHKKNHGQKTPVDLAREREYHDIAVMLEQLVAPTMKSANFIA